LWEGIEFEPTSQHKYLYVLNNPIMLIDPRGEASIGDLVITTSILENLSTAFPSTMISKSGPFHTAASWIPVGWPLVSPTRSLPSGGQRFGWRQPPTPTNKVVTDPNDPHYGLNFHDGVDLSAVIGTHVRATADGKVIFSQFTAAVGNKIEIRHSDGYVTKYAHLSKMNVKKEDWVKRNEIIGLSGATGTNVTAAHLHYSIYHLGVAVNPVPFMIGLHGR
jgi:murein DD-endopeptidase MepM/ murein hydrolase activator NlpD